jgi:RNA polymerase sigma-70 factor, ECF subfamily
MSRTEPPGGGITAYLRRWGEGDRTAFDAMMPLVEGELRRLARRSLREERRAHTLQPTALINELWLRLEAERAMSWHDRGHFFAVASQLMRFILVDYARRRMAGKRGGATLRVSLSEASSVEDTSCEGLLAIDIALGHLDSRDPRKAQVATLRLFSGASIEEIADVLGVSSGTVVRDWRFARSWLHRELQG